MCSSVHCWAGSSDGGWWSTQVVPASPRNKRSVFGCDPSRLNCMLSASYSQLWARVCNNTCWCWQQEVSLFPGRYQRPIKQSWIRQSNLLREYFCSEVQSWTINFLWLPCAQVINCVTRLCTSLLVWALKCAQTLKHVHLFAQALRQQNIFISTHLVPLF